MTVWRRRTLNDETIRGIFVIKLRDGKDGLEKSEEFHNVNKSLFLFFLIIIQFNFMIFIIT